MAEVMGSEQVGTEELIGNLHEENLGFRVFPI
jgi:hypothetical protein